MNGYEIRSSSESRHSTPRSTRSAFSLLHDGEPSFGSIWILHNCQESISNGSTEWIIIANFYTPSISVIKFRHCGCSWLPWTSCSCHCHCLSKGKCVRSGKWGWIVRGTEDSQSTMKIRVLRQWFTLPKLTVNQDLTHNWYGRLKDWQTDTSDGVLDWDPVHDSRLSTRSSFQIRYEILYKTHL